MLGAQFFLDGDATSRWGWYNQTKMDIFKSDGVGNEKKLLRFTRFLICFIASYPVFSQTIIHVFGVEEGAQLKSSAQKQAVYMLHLGTFNQKNNALRQKKELHALTGEPVHLKVTKNANGPYLVFMGPYSNVDAVHQTSQTILMNKRVEHPTHVQSSQSKTSLIEQPLSYSQMSSFSPDKDQVTPSVENKAWTVMGSLGYTDYANSARAEGQTVVGRFSIERSLYALPSVKSASFMNNYASVLGLEVGVQSGNQMQLDVSESIIDAMGGLPIQTTVQPMFDLLGTLKLYSRDNASYFGVIKGGFAYRRWVMDRDTINNLYQLAGEVQAGLGLNITPHTNLAVLYQGIYGANPNFQFNSQNLTGVVANIPIQNGILLTYGITY